MNYFVVFNFKFFLLNLRSQLVSFSMGTKSCGPEFICRSSRQNVGEIGLPARGFVLSLLYNEHSNIDTTVCY